MNRHLHNTLSAMSATAVMLAAVLIVASPAPHGAEPAVEMANHLATPNPSTLAGSPARQVTRPYGIDARAARLAAQLESSTSPGETIARVAAFTAEVATVTALTAVLADLPEAPDAPETSGVVTAPASSTASKYKRSRQSQAMPYFSFASRS